MSTAKPRAADVCHTMLRNTYQAVTRSEFQNSSSATSLA
jgi:hypothetical protein